MEKGIFLTFSLEARGGIWGGLWGLEPPLKFLGRWKEKREKEKKRKGKEKKEGASNGRII